MNESLLSRRAFLGLMALLGSGPVWSGELGPDGRSLYLSAASDAAGGHWLKGFTLEGGAVDLLFSHPLPARAHAVAVHREAGIFVCIARRPGRFLVVGDLASGKLLQTLNVAADRHLYGHGVFSADGRRFYTTESDFQNLTGDSGLLAVWDVEADKTLKRQGEFPTHGVGPHEVLLMPDQRTLVIANGGIRTHPGSERDKLNVDTMAPSLVYIDRESGVLKGQYRLPQEFHQASIRHLDVNGQGRVALAMQFEGPPFQSAPLVATHSADESVKPLALPEEVRIGMRQYVGSIRYDLGGRFLAASCPRGNMVTFWDSDSEEYLDQVRARDGCGICAVPDGFMISAGSTGKLRHYDLAAGTTSDYDLGDVDFPEPVFWDNHLTLA